MKKSLFAPLLLVFAGLIVTTAFALAEHGVYAGLVPGSSKKIVVQIVPDKTYEKVVAHLNFYSADNKRVGQKAFSITDGKDKYVRKDVCTTKIFKIDFDDVKRVAIDYVNTGEVIEEGGAKGTKIGLPVVTKALAPFDK